MQQQKTRNLWLDLFRYLLAFFVIGIHFQSFPKIVFPIFRIAVPAFFMITGFFLYSDDKEKQIQKNKNFIKSSLKYLLIGFAIYILYAIFLCISRNASFNDFFKSLFYDDFIKNFIFLNIPNIWGVHLWYLICLFVTSIIHYFCSKFDLTKYYIYIAPSLLAVALFFAGYAQVEYVYFRNAIFLGFPTVCIGYLLGRFKNHSFNIKHKITFGILAIVFLFLQIAEDQIYSTEFYISSILSAIFFVLFFTNISFKNEKISNWYYKYIGKDCPFYIFILHVLIGDLLVYYTNINGIITNIVIFLCSFAFYVSCHLIILLIKGFKLKYQKKRQY